MKVCIMATWSVEVEDADEARKILNKIKDAARLNCELEQPSMEDEEMNDITY